MISIPSAQKTHTKTFNRKNIQHHHHHHLPILVNTHKKNTNEPSQIALHFLNQNVSQHPSAENFSSNHPLKPPGPSGQARSLVYFNSFIHFAELWRAEAPTPPIRETTTSNPHPPRCLGVGLEIFLPKPAIFGARRWHGQKLKKREKEAPSLPFSAKEITPSGCIFLRLFWGFLFVYLSETKIFLLFLI